MYNPKILRFARFFIAFSGCLPPLKESSFGVFTSRKRRGKSFAFVEGERGKRERAPCNRLGNYGIIKPTTTIYDRSRKKENGELKVTLSAPCHFGLESVLSPKFITASHMLRLVRGLTNSQGSVMNALYRIADGAAEAMEFTVTASTRHLGTPLRDLSLKPGILVAVVARGGEIIIPEGSTSIQEGDSVILISRDRRLQDLNDIYDEGEHTFSAPGGMS